MTHKLKTFLGRVGGSILPKKNDSGRRRRFCQRKMILGDASSLSSGRSLLQLPSGLRPVVWEVAFSNYKIVCLASALAPCERQIPPAVSSSRRLENALQCACAGCCTLRAQESHPVRIILSAVPFPQDASSPHASSSAAFAGAQPPPSIPPLSSTSPITASPLTSATGDLMDIAQTGRARASPTDECT